MNTYKLIKDIILIIYISLLLTIINIKIVILKYQLTRFGVAKSISHSDEYDINIRSLNIKILESINRLKQLWKMLHM